MFLKHLNPSSQGLVSNAVKFLYSSTFPLSTLLSSFHDTDDSKNNLQRGEEEIVKAVSRPNGK